jgi:hypothetical protein
MSWGAPLSPPRRGLERDNLMQVTAIPWTGERRCPGRQARSCGSFVASPLRCNKQTDGHQHRGDDIE